MHEHGRLERSFVSRLLLETGNREIHSQILPPLSKPRTPESIRRPSLSTGTSTGWLSNTTWAVCCSLSSGGADQTRSGNCPSAVSDSTHSLGSAIKVHLSVSPAALDHVYWYTHWPINFSEIIIYSLTSQQIVFRVECTRLNCDSAFYSKMYWARLIQQRGTFLFFDHFRAVDSSTRTIICDTSI